MIDFKEFYLKHEKEIEKYFLQNNLDIEKGKKLHHGCGIKNRLYDTKGGNQQFYDFAYMPKSDKKPICIDGDSVKSKVVLTIWYINNQLVFEQNELTREILGK